MPVVVRTDEPSGLSIDTATAQRSHPYDATGFSRIGDAIASRLPPSDHAAQCWRRSPPIRARWTPDAPTVTPPRSAPEVRSSGSDSKAGSGGPARHQQPVGRLVFNRLATTRPERTVTWCLPIADVRVDRGDVRPASVHRGTGQDAQRWQEVQLAGLRAVQHRQEIFRRAPDFGATLKPGGRADNLLRNDR